jgi:phosphoribosyl 1,2-cyclic phosphodiesterase
MDMYFCPLYSGSSGNALFCQYGNTRLLIDAGKSGKTIEDALASIGADIRSISGVLITHEHSDHIAGLRVLAAQLGVPVYATRGTLAGLNNLQILDGKFHYEPMLPGGVKIGDIQVTNFRTSHDSKESCGYIIKMPDRTVGICTDTGTVTDEMLRVLSACDLVLLESNYDDDMLLEGYYPPYLKARIRSEMGHLSNYDCASAACALYDLGVRRFVLGHLSRENNRPEIALTCTRTALSRFGAQPGRDFDLRVAPVEAMPEYIVF